MAKSRKQREKDAERLANLVGAAALFVGVMVYANTGSISSGIVALLVLLACVITVLWLRRNARRLETFRYTTVTRVDDGNWEEFESYLVALFHAKGYKAELTPNGADFGADLLLERNGELTVVQAKHWKRRDVSAKAVQEVVAAKAHYKADKAMVVISGDFTQQAIELARSNGVELWDRQRLVKEMPANCAQSTWDTDEEDLEDVEVECPRCGSTMVLRDGKYGEFWGCPNFPRCRGTRPLDEVDI